MILVGDCVELMAAMPDASVDAVVTDPPYGLEFMGKEWDRLEFAGGGGNSGRVTGTGINRNSPRFYYQEGRAQQDWHHRWATEALRVLKPGGHLLAFGGTRTYHRLACAIEDAGFEIRDTLCWLYGSGFPKSLDVSKAIDRKRDDLNDIQRVTTFVAANRGGKSNREIDAHFGFNGMAGHWTNTRGAQAAVPTWDQWLALKDLCGFGDEMDAEVWRLNGRKGQPGEAWNERPITGKAGQLWEAWEASVGLDARARSGERRDIPATPEAQRWQGWGTALKPAHEPIVVARKPLAGTVAGNVLEHGTGALNIGGCRIVSEGLSAPLGQSADVGTPSETIGNGRDGEASAERRYTANGSTNFAPLPGPRGGAALGRWPANVVLDEEAAAMLDEQSGERPGFSSGGTRGAGFRSEYVGGDSRERTLAAQTFNDSGGASRFFYVAKASRAERNAGLEGFEAERVEGMNHSPRDHGEVRDHIGARNHHPTVKPIALMRWLARLVTPPGGLVLDPFAGSGTTGIACALEGFEFTGCEQDADYAKIAEARIAFWAEHGEDGLRIVAERERAEAEREAVAASGQLDIFATEGGCVNSPQHDEASPIRRSLSSHAPESTLQHSSQPASSQSRAQQPGHLPAKP